MFRAEERKGRKREFRTGAIAFLIFLTLLPAIALAQVRTPFQERGPAGQDPSLADRAEVVRLLGRVDDGGLTPFDIEVLDCDDGAPCTLEGADLGVADASQRVHVASSASADTQLATASGRFNPLLPGGDQVVFATALAGDGVILELCSQNGGDPCPVNLFAFSSDNIADSSAVAIFGADGIEARRFVQLAAAQLDSDPLDELVLAYWREDFTIAIEVFDWDPVTGMLARYELPAAQRASLDSALFRSARLALATADFDGNLIDSIAIVTPSGAAPAPRNQLNDFESFRVDFFDFLVSSTKCASGSPCIVARGSDFFSQHRFTGTLIGNPPEVFDHMTRFINSNAAGRPVGCQTAVGQFETDCYLSKLETRGARLTPSPSVGNSFERALPEFMVVLADYIYVSDNFRQTSADLITMRPARCGAPPGGQPNSCAPGADDQDLYLAHLPACDVGTPNAQYPREACQQKPGDPLALVTNSILRHLLETTLGSAGSTQPSFLTRFPQNNPVCLATGDLTGGPLEEIAVFRSQFGLQVFEAQIAPGAELQDVLPLNAPGSAQGQLGAFNYSDGPAGIAQGDCDLSIADLDGDPIDTSPGRLSSWDREVVAASSTSFERDGDCFPVCFLVQFGQDEVVDVWRVDLTESSPGDPGGDFTGLTLLPASSQVRTLLTDAQHLPALPQATSFPDWDEDALRLGPGQVVLDAALEQPTLVLSAPPRHLDLLDELDNPPACLTDPMLDVNWAQCDGPEGNGTCDGLVTKYQTAMSESYGSRIENTVSRSISGGFSVGPFGASVDRKYTDTDITTGGDGLTQTTSQDADYVDAASGSNVRYRVYEYEVFEGDSLVMDGGVPERPVTVSIVRTLPGAVDTTDVPSNPLIITTHVPGNLLSYKPLDYYRLGTGECCSLGSPSTSLSYTPNRVTIGSVSDGSWDLTQTISNGTEASKSGSLVFQAGGSGSYYGVGVSFSGSYENSTTTTHTTDVSNAVVVGWEYTNESSSSSLPYRVTPFVRIDPTGAVVLDYAVDIIDDPSAPNCLNTVYRLQSDPAIALPRRRNFAQLGAQVTSSVERLQTKELACTYQPSNQTFDLQARIHNYSLVATPAVDVEFWLGDPREPSQDSVLLATSVAPAIAPQDDIDNASAIDVVVPGAVSALFICDGEGDEPEGAACSDDVDCGDGGSCVPTLGAPYNVCSLEDPATAGQRCQQDADCGSGSMCMPESRLFVRIDAGDVVTELSEDNNLGWRFLQENCLPEQTTAVPEPGATTSAIAGLLMLAGLRRWRRGSLAR
jgi:hypothetical protein